MDYDKYEDVQQRLGTVSATFKSNMQEILAVKEIDDDTRSIIEDVCEQVGTSLDQICSIISHALEAAAD